MTYSYTTLWDVTEGREGGFSVFDRLDPANLRFTDLIVSPAEALPGEPVRISFVIANQGEESDRTEVEFRINEVLTELRSLAVAGREQLRVVFEFVPPAEGAFSVELIDPDELVPSLRGTILAKVPEVSATFSFDRPSITPLEVGPGQEVSVVSRLTNFGDLEGALTAILELDGEEVARQDVFRDPLVSGNVTFTITAPQEPGNYTLRLGGEVLVGDPALFPVQGTFRVLVAPLAVIVESLNVAPDPVLAGQRLTISVVLTNPTGQAGTRVLSLSIDGDPVVPDTSVALEAGETLTETFTVVAPAEAGTHTLAIDGLTSQFEVGAVGAPAAFNLVAPMFIDPSQVSPGQRVTISVVVRNDGGETGSTDVILSVRGTEVERQTVDIDPGGDETVVFQITRDDAGDYAVQVEAVGTVDVPRLTGSFSVVRLLSAVASTISVEPALVESGTAVVISVDVTNSGTVDVTETFVLTVDGTRVDDQTVTLAAGETSTITFTHIERDAGTHRANVDGQTAEFEVTEAVAAAGGGPIIIIIVVVVVVVVAAGAGGFFFLRRKSA